MTAKKPLHQQADYILDLLVSAGYITREKAFQASDIAREFPPSPEAGEAVRKETLTTQAGELVEVALLLDLAAFFDDSSVEISGPGADERASDLLLRLIAWRAAMSAPPMTKRKD